MYFCENCWLKRASPPYLVDGAAVPLLRADDDGLVGLPRLRLDGDGDVELLLKALHAAIVDHDVVRQVEHHQQWQGTLKNPN